MEQWLAFLIPIESTILVGFMAVMGFLLRRNESLHKESREALATQSTALAVLLTEIKPVERNTQDIQSLKTTTAVLKDAIDRHGKDIEQLRRTRNVAIQNS